MRRSVAHAGEAHGLTDLLRASSSRTTIPPVANRGGDPKEAQGMDTIAQVILSGMAVGGIYHSWPSGFA